METKICIRCKIEKSFEEFFKGYYKGRFCDKFGWQSKCKNCLEEIEKDIKLRRKIYKKQKEDYTKKLKENRERIKKIKKLNRKIRTNLTNRINSAIRKNFILKKGHLIDLLGCNIEQLKKHLEKQFRQGMSWDNWGVGENGKGMTEWHIDHIRPCFTFDLSRPEEQAKCFNYTNLRPLWAKENLLRPKNTYKHITNSDLLWYKK
jgi:hypothetical protein